MNTKRESTPNLRPECRRKSFKSNSRISNGTNPMEYKPSHSPVHVAHRSAMFRMRCVCRAMQQLDYEPAVPRKRNLPAVYITLHSQIRSGIALAQRRNGMKLQ